jgi:hypothetical protein
MLVQTLTRDIVVAGTLRDVGLYCGVLGSTWYDLEIDPRPLGRGRI